MKPSFKRKPDDSALLQKFSQLSIRSQAPSLADQLKKLKLTEPAALPDEPSPVSVPLVSATPGKESAPSQVQKCPQDVSVGRQPSMEASASLQCGSTDVLPPNL